MKKSLFLLIYAVSLIVSFTPAVADPGCLKVIQGKAIDERAAKLLPQDCQEFRKTYLNSLHLLSLSSKKFSHSLAKEIQAKKSFEPPYHALVVAVLAQTRDPELVQAIASRAKIENSKNFKFKYAAAAQERIEKGNCSPQFSEVAYQEICQAKDQVYTRIEKLRGDQ